MKVLSVYLKDMKLEKLLRRIILVSLMILIVGTFPFMCKFSGQKLSDSIQEWGAFGDYFSLIINMLNLLVVGMLSYFVFVLQKRRDEFESTYIEAEERPTLIFAVDVARNQWYIYNVGKGAALNVIIAEDHGDKTWQNPKKCYSIASGEKLYIDWFVAAFRILGIYSDIFNNNCYASICISDETLTEKFHMKEEPQWVKDIKGKATRLSP